MAVDEPTVRKVVARVGQYVLVGDGSPEGVVDAPFSATFQRRDGAPGSSIYVKETSLGDLTGWRAL